MSETTTLFYAERVRAPGYRICDASAFVWPPIDNR